VDRHKAQKHCTTVTLVTLGLVCYLEQLIDNVRCLYDLYRCAVHLDINDYVHRLMHLFIILESTKIHTKMLLHVSVYDHHQGALT
jgi:hypothetical protein